MVVRLGRLHPEHVPSFVRDRPILAALAIGQRAALHHDHQLAAGMGVLASPDVRFADDSLGDDSVVREHYVRRQVGVDLA